MNIDLHCHSTASDGLLKPGELVARAAANGVEVLALTDHDDLSGLAEARAKAESEGVRFVDGVEISVTWEGSTVHIVGLQIDPGRSRKTGGENGRSARRCRYSRQPRGGENLRREPKPHQPLALRASPGEDGPGTERKERVSALPRERQAGLCPASVGLSRRRRELDPRKRRDRGGRTPGSL